MVALTALCIGDGEDLRIATTIGHSNQAGRLECRRRDDCAVCAPGGSSARTLQTREYLTWSTADRHLLERDGVSRFEIAHPLAVGRYKGSFRQSRRGNRYRVEPIETAYEQARVLAAAAALVNDPPAVW